MHFGPPFEFGTHSEYGLPDSDLDSSYSNSPSRTGLEVRAGFECSLNPFAAVTWASVFRSVKLE